ncbi:gag-pol polyprotein [Artemisia annua]|uniref:Gag-pol polyprotein n=1 Tax=Artemisia annua TaxID=35608 RepID=A0A2U1PLI3_ARTAN|nr:gag-pol polyprotein [Artemisia annua]
MGIDGVSIGELRVDDKKRLVEEPVAIVDRKVIKLRKKILKLVKVQWKHNRGDDMTWEAENEMRERYPHPFISEKRFGDRIFLREGEL